LGGPERGEKELKLLKTGEKRLETPYKTLLNREYRDIPPGV